MGEEGFQGFENLEVWKLGCQVSVETYSAFGNLKDFGFKDQICRSAVSIPSNIAEGYERNGSKEFAKFLNLAKRSCGEFKTQVYIAQKIGYIDSEVSKSLLAKAKQVAAMLASLIQKVKSSEQLKPFPLTAHCALLT